jgi:hypothetical protein
MLSDTQQNGGSCSNLAKLAITVQLQMPVGRLRSFVLNALSRSGDPESALQGGV